MLYTSFYVHCHNQEEAKIFDLAWINDRVILTTKLGYSSMTTHYTLDELKDLKDKINNFLLDH